MKLQQLPNKIANKLSSRAFQLLSRDRITGNKVKTRNDLEKIGSEYGGWIVPVKLLNADSICYCVGCGEDISFDLGAIDRFGCDIFAFDPTPRAIEYVNRVAEGLSQYHFYEVGLWDKQDELKFYTPQNSAHVSHSLLNLQKTDNYIQVPVNRLANIMQNLGHGRLDLIKLDIEGAEYKVIESILEDRIEITIICVEYDEYFNPLDRDFKTRIKNSINSLLENDYTLVCAQGNGNYTFVRDV